MLKFVSYDIVFQEIPDEVTLALNISGCPNRCPGCHSPHLRDDIGEPLSTAHLSALLARYGDMITCVCFMGGDAFPEEVVTLSRFVRSFDNGRIRTGWYSGRQSFPANLHPGDFDYVKLGPYIEAAGGLKSPATNQRLYKTSPSGIMTDITELFRR